MTVKALERETEWAGWMRLAMDGDARAYHCFLEAVTPHLRRLARRCASRYGGLPSDLEDVVQEVLLASAAPGIRPGRSAPGWRPSSATS